MMLIRLGMHCGAELEHLQDIVRSFFLITNRALRRDNARAANNPHHGNVCGDVPVHGQGVATEVVKLVHVQSISFVGHNLQ